MLKAGKNTLTLKEYTHHNVQNKQDSFFHRLSWTCTDKLTDLYVQKTGEDYFWKYVTLGLSACRALSLQNQQFVH